MVDVNALKGIIASRGKSQAEVANYLGITPKTFYEKMKKGVFDSDGMYQMIEFLEIKNPSDIFFANFVT